MGHLACLTSDHTQQQHLMRVSQLQDWLQPAAATVQQIMRLKAWLGLELCSQTLSTAMLRTLHQVNAL